MSAVSVTRDGPVTTVELDRPEKLNAFNGDLVDGLARAVAAAEADDTRLLVFRGAGKGFSGGFDLSGLDEMSDGDLLLRFVRVEEVLQAVHHARVATLALVHGACYGAAADLAAACHWRVAAPDARFRMPGARFGIVLGTRRLAALVGADRARALLLRDAPFDAGEALASGFVTEIAGQDDWPAVQERVLGQAQALDPMTLASLTRRMTADTRDEDLVALVRSAAHGSVKERIRAYLAEMAARRG